MGRPRVASPRVRRPRRPASGGWHKTTVRLPDDLYWELRATLTRRRLTFTAWLRRSAQALVDKGNGHAD